LGSGVRGERLEGVQDGTVASAATDVAAKRILHLSHGRHLATLQQTKFLCIFLKDFFYKNENWPVHVHDHARRAVAALGAVEVRQLRLHLVVAPLAIADALDGRDLPAMARVQRHQTLQIKINCTGKFLEDSIHENKICSRRILAFLPLISFFFTVVH
jgi:hypothetical protein